MKLPSELELFFANIKREENRKKIILAGRRSGKSIWTLLGIAKEYLPKEQYQKLVADIEAELKPLGKRYGFKMCEVEDFDNWKSANEVFGGK